MIRPAIVPRAYSHRGWARHPCHFTTKNLNRLQEAYAVTSPVATSIRPSPSGSSSASASPSPIFFPTGSRKSSAASPEPGVLYIIASGKAGFSLTGGFASNGYADHSPGGYSLVACLVAEIVLTFFFLLVIMGATDHRAPNGFPPIAIDLCLTLIHLIGIPIRF